MRLLTVYRKGRTFNDKYLYSNRSLIGCLKRDEFGNDVAWWGYTSDFTLDGGVWRFESRLCKMAFFGGLLKR